MASRQVPRERIEEIVRANQDLKDSDLSRLIKECCERSNRIHKTGWEKDEMRNAVQYALTFQGKLLKEKKESEVTA